MTAIWWGDFCIKNMPMVGHSSDLGKLARKNTDSPGMTGCTCLEDGDRITISIQKIRCVLLEEISIPDEWNPSRSKAIEEWADMESMMSLVLRECLAHIPDGEEMQYVNEQCEMDISINKLPRYNRRINFETGEKEKYRIADGIHRTNWAKNHHLPCIMAMVTDEYEMSKNYFMDQMRNPGGFLVRREKID